MSNNERLPLKKVAIREGDYFRPEPGGSKKKVFGDVTPQVRNRMAGAVSGVGVHFQSAFQSYPKAAAVARVVLKGEALAKSHRPNQLFETTDCPIVGVGGFGELLVSVRAASLPRLQATIQTGSTNELVANISTIRTIEPFALQEAPLAKLSDALAKDSDMPVKLRMFRHGLPLVDTALKRALEAQLAALHIEVEQLAYGASLAVFRLSGVRPAHVPHLARFVGTQSLGAFPEYHVVKPTSQPVGKLTPASFPPPEKGVEYPVVGLIDTGIAPSNPLLAPWISGREEYVPAEARDYEHGTFIGGLLVHACALNHNDARFPECACRILDVVALPGNGRISEEELLAILREVVPKHPEVRVWNLSLGGSEPCSDHCFSDLAIALDDLQREHGVTFVLAAGNYNVPPFRGWPASGVTGDADRICGPADSTRALTVGSVAHRDSATARVMAPAPSPFARRGPGPVFLPKPEVVHYGGNCDALGRHAQIGVLSVDGAGNLAESIGTSFASPIVAALLAHVQALPREPLSSAMAKALVIHSAALAEANVSAEDLPYRGFGVPQSVDAVLGCDRWRATLLFEIELRAGLDLQRTPLPIPACLCDAEGKLRGEMIATLVYEPPLDGTFGAEYCRSNVNVSIGTFGGGGEAGSGQARQVHPFPQHAPASAEEKALVEHGFKWSPVKVYRRRMPRGVAAATWRLVVDATDRSGSANEAIRAALVITIADPARSTDVYNDVVVAMNRLGWAASDVTLRARVRPRAA
jgi:hypothetical protein